MPLLVALTVLTGVVDAVSYLELGHVFVANMTGNIIFLGFALAGAGGLSPVASLIALAAFLLGALAGGWLGARYHAHRGHVLRAANATQVLLIAAADAAREPRRRRPPTRATRYALIVLLALALGRAERRRTAALGAGAHDDRADAHADRARLRIQPRRRCGVEARAPASSRSARCCSVRLTGGLLALHVSIAAALGAALAIVFCTGLAAHLLSRSGGVWTRG